MPASKNRSPSKCREWERERRNRFNDAFNKLATLIIPDKSDKSVSGNTHLNLAKVEIIQRAIALISSLLQTKSQLDAQLLAAQTEISDLKNAKANCKDVSVQVNKQIKVVEKGSKTKTILFLEKKRKEKKLAPSIIRKDSNKIDPPKLNLLTPPKLPKLLPKSSEKKEKGISILPAPPYISPQRPVVLPQQPTFVLLEPMMPTSRGTMLCMPRVISEITKTTMVNNLPIAAFSFPLSISKSKKTNDRSNSAKKQGIVQKRRLKVVKNCKTANKPINEPKELKENKIPKKDGDKINSQQTLPEKNEIDKSIANKDIKTNDNLSSSKEQCGISEKSFEIVNNESISKIVIKNSSNIDSSRVDLNSLKESNISNNIETTKIPEISTSTHNSSNEKTKHDGHISEQENKEKQEKLHSILDTNIIDSTVDGGNARLELAEELLAASPTAAFLMSFPLVSGVRADSPADDDHNSVTNNSLRSTQQKRDQIRDSLDQSHIETLFNKSRDENKIDRNTNTVPEPQFGEKLKTPEKLMNVKGNYGSQNPIMTPHSLSEHSFLNLIPSVLGSTSAANDGIFSLDFDTNFTKNATNATYSYANSTNLLFKTDSSNTKNNIAMYTSNGLPVGHDYKNFGLYPCAMEKYSHNSKNKNDYGLSDDNLSKIGHGRLPYDFDLNFSQKPYEFTTNSNNISTVQKDNNVAVSVTTMQNTYNIFNPDNNVTFSANSMNNISNKKPNSKANPFYADTFSNLYSQPSNLWPEEINLYANNSVNLSKTSSMKPQGYTSANQFITTTNKYNNNNIFELKEQNYSNSVSNKPSKHEVNQLVSEKNSKKSSSKSHINWMTSEARSSHNSFDFQHDTKDQTRVNFSGAMSHNTFLPHLDYNIGKKQDYLDNNLFPISVSSHSNQDDIQLWPPTRPFVASEICLDPPPINLPTLVGDLALGPQERRKSVERVNRGSMSQDLSGCNNFLSVSQIMNRSSNNDLPIARVQSNLSENSKMITTKSENIFAYPNAAPDKSNQLDKNNMQPGFLFNDSKYLPTQYNMSHPRQKNSKSSDRTKCHKNNYSTEALLKGPNKIPDNFSAMKFMNSTQKLAGYPNQESQIAQVSHFPCIAEYTDNSYSGSALYNATTSTVSNTFYGNLMPSYTPANFTSEFVDYASAASADCNFYPIFDNYKMKNQADSFAQAKANDFPKTTHKETVGKHKAEYPKKEHSKKFSSKRAKISNELEEWNESADNIQQTSSAKKNTYAVGEEMTFANYSVNQAHGQVHNSVLPDVLSYSAALPPPISARTAHCPTNVSRTNFNLSTLFPEIAKVRPT